MADPKRIPIAAQIKCVQREIGLRVGVYPRLIETGKLTKAEAEYELAAMRAVLETLKAHDERPRLFPDSPLDSEAYHTGEGA
jgi:hypothetical protein